jgi:hypothetical protein
VLPGQRAFFRAGLSMGNGGGGFDLRFNLSRKARCAFRLGVGPRASGFCMSIYKMLRAIGAVNFIG